MAPVPSPSSVSRLSRLSEIISRNSKLLNSYLIDKQLPQPSFAIDAPTDGIVIDKSAQNRTELEHARRELISATKELHDLSVGPREGVRDLAWRFNDQLSLHFIYRFGIASAFEPGTTITFSELAARTKTPLHDLKRLVRHAITNRIFSEPTKNTIAHTATSALLARDEDTQAWAGMTLEEFWPGSTKTVAAMQKWPGSQEPTQTGLSLDVGEEKGLWDVVTSSPARMKRFGIAMKSLSEGEGFEITHLVNDYDWASVGKAASSTAGDNSRPKGTVVDVGGSYGYACAAIGARFPHLDFIVQDLARLYAHIDPMEKVPAEMRDRISFSAHDFFNDQDPTEVGHADVFLIRWCMHNWSDKYAIKILRALVPAFKKGARVVINDGVLPEPKPLGGSWTSSAKLTHDAAAAAASDKIGTEEASEDVDADYRSDKSMRDMDLIMLQGLNARERDLGEWQDLFRAADERFVWKGARRSGRMWVLEAEWSG